jgi:hypothetical protein
LAGGSLSQHCTEAQRSLKSQAPPSEPPRVCRRQFLSNQSAMADCSSTA